MTQYRKNLPPASADASTGWTAKVLPSKVELKDAIASIGPREETVAGIAFYQKLLKERGVQGVLDTVARFRSMLDEGDGLDLAEMKKHERTTYNSIPRPYLNRRTFLGSTAWGLVGVSAVGGSVLSAADSGYQALTIKKKPDEKHGDVHDEGAANYAKIAHDAYQKHVLPYENIIVGAALVNEGIEKWEEIRLRQLQDTVLRLGKIPEEILGACDKDELLQHIHAQSMGGKHKDWVAEQFLSQLLNQKGEAAVLHFIKRARHAIDHENELDLEIDFDPKKTPDERRLFDAIKCDPRRLSVSDFLETWGWVLPGLVCVSEGGLQMHKSHIMGQNPQAKTPLLDGLKAVVSDPSYMVLGTSLINEFNLNWKEIKLEQIADAVIELKHKSIDWKTIQPQALEEMIDNLDEPQEKFAGIYFLKALLKHKGGVALVESFIGRAGKQLDASSAQNLVDCFSTREKSIFKQFRCRPNMLNAENFLHTVGWGIPGAICLMTGASGAADLAIKAVTGRKETLAGTVRHEIHDRLGHIEGLIIGAALINEALEKFREIKLGQISDATAQLVESTKAQGVMYK